MSKALTPEEKIVIASMARSDLKASHVCQDLDMSQTWVEKRIKSVLGKTGLSPKRFYDLVALLDLVGEEAGNEKPEINSPQSRWSPAAQQTYQDILAELRAEPGNPQDEIG